MNLNSLQIALESFNAATAELPLLEKFFADSKTRLADLELSADLKSAKALTEIISLQAIGQLELRRVECAKGECSRQHALLFTATEEFSKQVLMPRCTELRGRVAKAVGGGIAKHYDDEISLQEAINRSATMQKLDAMISRAGVGGNDSFRPRQTAERLIQVWGELDEFEQKHLK